MTHKQNKLIQSLIYGLRLISCFTYLITWLANTCTLASEHNTNEKSKEIHTNTKTNSKQSKQIVIPAKPYTPANINESSKSGAILFVKNNCLTCHSVDDHGGCLGPPLMGEGSRRSKDFILSRITEGAKAEARFQQFYRASELMPHPRLPEKSAEAITAYLLTLKEPRSGFVMSRHQILNPNNISAISSQIQTPSQTSISTGKKLFYDKGCAACHTAGGVGGQFAPDLDGIATRRNRTYIEQIINKAQTLALDSADEYNERGTMMPPLNLTPKEVSKITDFLMTLPAK